MKEHNTGTGKPREPLDVEQRLAAYYGPPLPEQPLSQAAWQNLRLQLAAQEHTEHTERTERTGRRRRMRLHLPRKRFHSGVPIFIQDAFTRVSNQARVSTTPSMLRCSLKPRLREPRVYASWFGKLDLRLLLPLNAVMTMESAELDVLLATGLARAIVARKPAYRAGRLLLAGVVLITCIALILFWTRRLSLVGLPIAFALCASVVCLLHLQARSLAFYADTLIVRWLGRERACRGLHSLADRSRTPRHRRWSEPSLAERIERVCGLRVEAKENQLTLVG